MEKYSSQMAQRVWNRVWSETEPPKGEPGHLMMREAQALADYTKLQKTYPEIKALAEDIRQHIACLRGIRYWKEGHRPAPLAMKPHGDPAEAALRRCYVQSLKTAGEYADLSEDPEFGCIYSQLADTKRRHCRILLARIGNMDKGSK